MRLANALIGLTGPASCVGCRASGAALCPGCAAHLARPVADGAPSGVTRAVAALEYEGVVRTLVLELKLGARRDVATPLVQAMCRSARRAGLIGSAITWVPGRRSDIRVRGYDHARLLAVGVAVGLGLPAVRLLERARAVRDQSGLGADDRRLNLRGAFVARPAPHAVIVVDDVITTGATATAAARALTGAGAHAVELLVACRKS